MPTTVLISRPEIDAIELATNIRSACSDVHIIIAPALSIEPVSYTVPKCDFSAIVLTSKHAVAAAVSCKLDVPVLCVGNGTQKVAEKAGLNAISAQGTSKELAQLVQDMALKNILYIRGEYVYGNLENDLMSSGLEAQSVVAYRQVSCRFSSIVAKDIEKKESILVPVYSSRSAKIVSENLCEFKGLITVIAISRAVAEAWSGPQVHKMLCAQAPNSSAMLDAIASQLD